MSLHRRFLQSAAVLAASALVVGSASGVALAHGSGHGKSQSGHSHKSALYVSPGGKTGAADRNCQSAAYSTVQSAVDAAPSGGTVVVCRGTYTENVVISKPLTVSGMHGAVIQGSSTPNAACTTTAPCFAAITVKSGSVKIQGLKVTGATGEGILAEGAPGTPISRVVIQHNRVVGNDLGGIPPTTSTAYPACVGHGGEPGDCGEGIHLTGVSFSKVSHNFVSNNSGGVLLSDEMGPTHNNVVSHNNVTKNLYDCGVTMPGHNPAADTAAGLQPNVAGVYQNVISHNRITGNGTQGSGGSGVLFANAMAGTASYNNLVEHNYIAGNGHSGVTLHAHTITSGVEDLSGNRIVHNTIVKNNLIGDDIEGGPASDPSTTGILVFSGTVPVTVTISHNRIRNDTYGIWEGVGGNVTATLSHNVFQHVGTKVVIVP